MKNLDVAIFRTSSQMRCTYLIVIIVISALGCSAPENQQRPDQNKFDGHGWELAGQFVVNEVVQDISILSNRRIELTCQQQYLMIYGIESGEVLDKIDTGMTTTSTFLMPKTSLMVVSTKDSLIVFNIDTKQIVLNIPNVEWGYLLNGDVLAVANSGDEQLIMWDIQQGQEVRRFESIVLMENYYSSVLTPYDRYSVVVGVSGGYWEFTLFEASHFRKIMVVRNKPALASSEIIWRANQVTQSRRFGPGIEVHKLVGDDIMSESTRACFVECTGQYCSADCFNQELVAIAFEGTNGASVDIWSTAKNKMIARLGPFEGQPHKMSWNETGDLLAIVTKTAHDSVNVSVFERHVE